MEPTPGALGCQFNTSVGNPPSQAGSGYIGRDIQGNGGWVNSTKTNCSPVEEWRHVVCGWSNASALA